MQLTDAQVLGLLELAGPPDEIESAEDDEFPDGRSIDGHRLLRLVGEGGMGRVYEAQRAAGKGTVALKVLRPELDSERERRRFIRTAEQAFALEHPNIVRVLHVEAEAASPYFTMDFVVGSPLSADMLRPTDEPEVRRGWRRVFGAPVPDDQRRIARLMSRVADAVDHAHKRGVLHRDLKPANILIDARGEPRLVDFGLARSLDPTELSRTSPGGLEGTLPYLPPEQIIGGSDSVQVRSDVYSLGATLYEVLTGRPPYLGPDDVVRQQILDATPVPALRSIAPWVHPYLEAVCLRCLEKEASRRYPSASALALDLQNIALGRPPRITPLSPWRRLLHAMRRHPKRTSRILQVIAFVVFAVVAGIYVWQVSERRYHEAMVANTAIASGQAGAALLQLRVLGDRVLSAAQRPEFVAYARSREALKDPGEALKVLSHGFDTAFVVSLDGYVRAQWPLPPTDIWDRSYLFREYFKGAKMLADRGEQGVYVAAAFRSERDDELKFAVSAPIYGEGRWVGVLVGAIATDSVFGAVRTSAGDPIRTTVLLGPRGADRAEMERDASAGHARERYVALIHEGLKRGQEVAVERSPELELVLARRAAPGAQFELEFPAPVSAARYADPVPGFEGDWIAALAPVGRTGYVIVAQSRLPSWW